MQNTRILYYSFTYISNGIGYDIQVSFASLLNHVLKYTSNLQIVREHPSLQCKRCLERTISQSSISYQESPVKF